MKDEIVYADKKTRNKLIALSAFAFIWILFAQKLYTYFFTNETSAKDPEILIAQISAQMSNFMLFQAILLSIVCIPTSIYMFWIGINTFKSGCYPPPGMKMAFDTRIKRGTYAKVASITIFIASVAVLLLPASRLWGWLMFKNI